MKGRPLKDSAELEKDFAMPGVAVAPANQHRSESGFEQEARGHIRRQSRFIWNAIRLTDFIYADSIDFASKERRFVNEAMKIASAEEEVLIAQDFVASVGREAQWTAQAEGW